MPTTSPRTHGADRPHGDRRGRTLSRTGLAALAAARRGHRVLPLWPNTKVPAHHGRDDCPGTGQCEQGHAGWEQRATADPQQLRAWWHARPDLNVGIATGPSGLHVLDLDRAAGESAPERWQDARHGRDVLATLAAEAGQAYPGDTFSVRTPRGGYHLYFRAPQVPRLRNTVGLVGWRIDSRGHGGFVVAPGSATRAGTYQVDNDRPIADLPGWLIPLLTPPAPLTVTEPGATAAPDAPGRAVALADHRRRDKYLRTVTATVAAAQEGQRRHTLLRAAITLGRLAAGGEYDHDHVAAALHQAASRLRGFPAREATRTITDGLRWGTQHPRRLSA